MAGIYHIYGIFIFILFLALATYLTRATWLPYLPAQFRPQRYDPVPSTPGTFHSDAAAGLHSTTFDLSANIEAGDSRAGLDERGKREVQRVMKARGVGFDEARRIVMQDRFRREGVGEDGRPRDPKFFSFS